MSRSQTAEERFDARHTKLPDGGCWIWSGTIGSGYGELRVHGKITKAHRYSYARFRGPIPAGICVCHSCDTPLCVNPNHLFLGTQADNIADMMAKGRNNQPHGERHGKTKLSNGDVLKIRQMLKELPRSHVARELGIPYRTITNIDRGDTWSRLEGVK